MPSLWKKLTESSGIIGIAISLLGAGFAGYVSITNRLTTLEVKMDGIYQMLKADNIGHMADKK